MRKLLFLPLLCGALLFPRVAAAAATCQPVPITCGSIISASIGLGDGKRHRGEGSERGEHDAQHHSRSTSTARSSTRIVSPVLSNTTPDGSPSSS